jgi:tetratricopeptide (TPR) repeat protein
VKTEKKPKVFVASSIEGLGIAYAVQQNLRYEAEVTVWDQGVFKLSATALESLGVVVSNSDFGIFVFSPDDIVTIRGEENATVRDNVIFELGLFVGRLTKSRCFVLVPEKTELRIPTDLMGLIPATYEVGRSDESDQAACGPACHQVRFAIRKLSFLHVDRQPSAGSAETNKPEEKTTMEKLSEEEEGKEQQEENWTVAVGEKRYDKAARLVRAQLKEAKTEPERERNKVYLALIEFEKDAKKGAEHFEELLRSYPKNSEVYSWFGYSYFWAELYDKALEIIERGIAESDHSGDLLGGKAQVLAKLGKRNDAISTLEKGIKEFPQCERLYVELAAFYAESKDFKKATNRLVQGIQALPKSQLLLRQYADLLQANGNFAGAVQVYQRLVAVDDKNPTSYALLGNAYLALELNSMAYECYAKANELAGQSESWIISNIANVFNNVGLYAQAIKRFEEALKMDANSQYSHERLARAMTNKETQARQLADILNAAAPVFSLVDEKEPPPRPPTALLEQLRIPNST